MVALQRRARTLGEPIRVFPLSNWTELDVWHYVLREGIALPEIYFAHEREVVERDGMLYAVGECCRPRAGRSRSTAVGALPHGRRRDLTAAVRSDADTVDEIIEEIAVDPVTERGATRGDDRQRGRHGGPQARGYF